MVTRRRTAPVTRLDENRGFELVVGRETLRPGDYCQVKKGPGGSFPARFQHVELDDDGEIRWVTVTRSKPGYPSSTHSVEPDRIRRLSARERVRANSSDLHDDLV